MLFRSLFALGRRGLIAPRLGEIHAQHHTPWIAVIACGVLTAAAALLGEAILIPITEVGSLASAIGWLAACAAYWQLETRVRERAVAALGALVALTLVLMKVVPLVPGHFSAHEFAAMALWCAAGVLLRFGARGVPGRAG